MELAGVPWAPLGMWKLSANTEHDRAVLGSGGKHSSAAAVLNLILTSFASQQRHKRCSPSAPSLVGVEVERGALLMAHSTPNACVTRGTVPPREEKTALE